MDDDEAKIILYTSNFCSHARSVKAFLVEHEVPIEIRNISASIALREELIVLNNGFASVPTLIFPDGSQMTEPPLREVRKKLGIEPTDEEKQGVIGRLRKLLNDE